MRVVPAIELFDRFQWAPITRKVPSGTWPVHGASCAPPPPERGGDVLVAVPKPLPKAMRTSPPRLLSKLLESGYWQLPRRPRATTRRMARVTPGEGTRPSQGRILPLPPSERGGDVLVAVGGSINPASALLGATGIPRSGCLGRRRAVGVGVWRAGRRPPSREDSGVERRS